MSSGTWEIFCGTPAGRVLTCGCEPLCTALCSAPAVKLAGPLKLSCRPPLKYTTRSCAPAGTEKRSPSRIFMYGFAFAEAPPLVYETSPAS